MRKGFVIFFLTGFLVLSHIFPNKIMATPGNNSPEILFSALSEATEDSLYNYRLLGEDKDNDEISWRLEGDVPSWLSVEYKDSTYVSTYIGTRESFIKDGPIEEAETMCVNALTMDHKGNMYWAEYERTGDFYTYAIRKLDTDKQVSTVVETNSENGNIPLFTRIEVMVADKEDNLYFLDNQLRHQIFKLDLISKEITSFAGSEEGRAGSEDGRGSEALFLFISGLSIDESGNLYTAEDRTQTIRKVDKDGNVKTIFKCEDGDEDGPADTAKLHFLWDLIKVKNGDIFLVDQGGDKIKRLYSDKGVYRVETIAGKVRPAEVQDGSFEDATFDSIYALCSDDSADNIYVIDRSGIRKLDLKAKTVTTIAGSINDDGRIDGAGKNARFYSPTSIFYEKNNGLFVGEVYGHKIRKLTLSGYILSGTPQTDEDSGEYNLTIIASDGKSETRKDFILKVNAVNDTPEINIDDPKFDSETKIYKESKEGNFLFSGNIDTADEEGEKVIFKPTEGNEYPKGFSLKNDGSYSFDSSSYAYLKPGETKKIKVNVSAVDESGASCEFVFDIEIKGVNDAPSISSVNNIIEYKNFGKKIIFLNIEDVDNSLGELTVNLKSDPDDIVDASLKAVDDLNEDHNYEIIITSRPEAFGKGSITIEVEDGEYKTIEDLKLRVFSLGKDDNIGDIGEVEVITDENKDGFKIKLPNDGIEVSAYEDLPTGNVTYSIDLEGNKIKGTSELAGSEFDITQSGACISHKGNGIESKISSSVKGITTAFLKGASNNFEIVSDLKNSVTRLFKEEGSVNLKTEIVSEDGLNIKVSSCEYGGAKGEFTNGDKTTAFTADSANNSIEVDEFGGFNLESFYSVDIEGNTESVTAVIKNNAVDSELFTWFEFKGAVEKTVDDSTPLEEDTLIKVNKDNDSILFEIKTDLTKELIIN